MRKSTQIALFICAFLMIGGYFLPFWKITLGAPQYPEGLEMKIWLNKLSGDVSKVNGLNHYIGMKLIKEDEFPEFKILPVGLGILILFGLITASFNRRILLRIWVALLLISGSVAFYDFYKWEYDYGHNLNPMAAIKVPGMSYQPPLLGYKMLLNFVAGSFPDIGGIVVLGSALGIVILLVREERFQYKKNQK